MGSSFPFYGLNIGNIIQKPPPRKKNKRQTFGGSKWRGLEPSGSYELVMRANLCHLRFSLDERMRG